MVQTGDTYQSSYVPPFPFTAHTGRASQALALDRAFRPGIWAALEWLPAAHVGVSIRGAYRRAPLDGANSAYGIALDYFARQPPDYIDRQYHLDRSTPWPDTTGHLSTWTLDMEARWTSGPASRTRVHLGGGLSLAGISGSFEPVGLTTFQLGGHSVVFSDEYRAVLGIDRRWAPAAVASGGLTIPVTPHASIDLSGRILLPRTIAAPVHVRSVDGDLAIASRSVEEVQHMLDPPPVQLRLTAVEVLIGVKVGL
jgi:hypothetical protein